MRPARNSRTRKVSRVFDYTVFRKNAGIRGKWTKPLATERAISYMEEQAQGTKFILMGELEASRLHELSRKIFPGSIGHYFSAENLEDGARAFDAFLSRSAPVREFVQTDKEMLDSPGYGE
ncbi:hypothetical protein [Streptomyces sp. NPDC008121]|uniref:hypothetical protein n=1 Tax=Streptomyces sp. NPDC008121 TaxID=3364809 RepID=UPI0036E0DCB8